MRQWRRLPRRPVIRFDRVPQLDGPGVRRRAGRPSWPPRSCRAATRESRPLNPPLVVEHLDHVGHQHVVVRAGVAGPRRAVSCRRRRSALPSRVRTWARPRVRPRSWNHSSSHSSVAVVSVSRIECIVIGVGRSRRARATVLWADDDQLEPRPLGRHQPRHRSPGREPARPERRLVRVGASPRRTGRGVRRRRRPIAAVSHRVSRSSRALRRDGRRRGRPRSPRDRRPRRRPSG